MRDDAGTALDLSIVVPLYNEEGNVAPLCAAVRDAMALRGLRYELLLVDDGSTDLTRDRLREEGRRDGRLRVLLLRSNRGQTLAMAAGFARARGRIVVSMDGDLQNDPRDIPSLVATVKQGYDIVCGWRKDRRDAWLSRTLPSRVANRLIFWVTGVPVHDYGCSLKAYRREVVRSLRLYSDMHRFLPALASMAGARIGEIVVRHHPRTRGLSKYGLSRTGKVLSDLLIIKMLTQFGNRPGLWFGILALPWLFAGAASLTVWLVGLGWYGSRGSIVIPTLAVMFFYLFGHMMTLSVLGEMFLAHSDQRYLRRLAEVLATSTEIAPSGSVENDG